LQYDVLVLEEVLERREQQWRDLLHDDVGDTRRVLRELPDGPLRFTPLVEGSRRGYRFEGRAHDRRDLGGIGAVL
jgi:hypothetical protein